MSKKILIGLIVIAATGIIIIGFFAAKYFNLIPDGKSESIDIKDWSVYQSEKYGYSVKYPEGWSLDYSGLSGASLQIIGPKEEVLVFVSNADDNRLTQEGGYELVMKDIESAFAKDPKIEIDRFERLPSDNKLLAGGYIARGNILGNRGNSYRFKEFGIFTSDGHAFSIIANIESDKTDQYGGIADEIIGSFDPLWRLKEEQKSQ